MEIVGVDLTRKQARRLIDSLRQRMPLDQAAQECGLRDGQWHPKGPSVKQLQLMDAKEIPADKAKSRYYARQLIEAKLNPREFKQKKLGEIASARNGGELTAYAKDVLLVKAVLPRRDYQDLVTEGKRKRYSWMGDAAE